MNTAELLDDLEFVAERPWFIASPVTFATVQSFLHGLRLGCRLAGVMYSWDDLFAAAAARGWDARGNLGIVRHFTRAGLTDEEMVREVFAVEIDAFRRSLTRPLGSIRREDMA